MKKDLQTGWLLMASLGMELSLGLAWAVMIMTPITQRLFSMPEAVLVFVTAVVITRFVYRNGWGRWEFFIAQSVGCLCACLLLSHALYRDFPLFSSAWIHAVFDPHKAPFDWLVLVLTFFWATVFWFGGMTLAQRSSGYLKICQRFDTGVGMLLGLFVIKIVIVHDKMLVEGQLMAWLMALFFIFGLMAIGLARHDGHTSRTFIAGYQVQGVLISVVIMMLMLGVILLTILWPCFNAAAEMGYVLFKAGMQTLGPFIITILSFIMRNNQVRRGFVPKTSDDGRILGTSDSWGGNLIEIFFWGLGAFAAIIAIIAIGLALRRFFHWLFSTTKANHDTPRRSGWLRDWLLRLSVFLTLCWEWVAQYIRNYNTIARIFRALLNWGKHSGVPYRQTETPLEFSQRLIRLLPAAHSEISVISNLFQQEIYAERDLNTQQFSQARIALRRLRSPALWISRIRLWFLER